MFNLVPWHRRIAYGHGSQPLWAWLETSDDHQSYRSFEKMKTSCGSGQLWPTSPFRVPEFWWRKSAIWLEGGSGFRILRLTAFLSRNNSITDAAYRHAIYTKISSAGWTQLIAISLLPRPSWRPEAQSNKGNAIYECVHHDVSDISFRDHRMPREFHMTTITCLCRQQRL